MGDRHLNKRKKSGHPRSYEVSYVCIGETDSLFLPKKRKTERGVLIEGERECVFSFFLVLTGRRCDCTDGDCSQCVSGTERERIILLHCRKPKLTEEARE